VSGELATKIRVGLEEFATVRQQFEPLISMSSDATVGVIETSAASAMLHSFYTEIEKILKLIAREWDRQLSPSDSWHKDLLLQMSQATAERPAVLSTGLVEVLNEFLAFRHLFRGASIALMRWDKLYPLVAKVDSTYKHARSELEAFTAFVEQQTGKA
jgi:ribonuclease HepT-like protein